MLITSLWKERMKDTLQMIYHNELKEEALDKFLDQKIQKSLDQGNRKLLCRNIYKKSNGEVDMNEILNIVEDKKFVILANNAFMESIETKIADMSLAIIDDLDGRKKEKELAKDYEKKGMLKEALLHDILQTFRKQNINSYYGMSGQMGSFFYNPDSASAITLQCQNIISEMMWSFEKLLGGNVQLQSYNEAFLYFNNILKEKRNYDSFKEWLSFIPSKKEFRAQMLKNLIAVKDYYNQTKRISKSLFYFLDTRTEEEMIYLYYKNNLKDLLALNPKIMNIFKNILTQQVNFYNPYDIPEVYKEDITTLFNIIEEFVSHHKGTFDRVNKYFNANRDIVLLSDTDSVFLCFQNLMTLIYNKTKIEKNMENNFKLVNTLCSICGMYIKIQHDVLLQDCFAVSPVPKYALNMKNEYYYKRMVLYAGVKKNYSGYILLREGNLVPEEKRMTSTGIKLTSGKIPKIIAQFQENIIEKYILQSDMIDPILILNEFKLMKQSIIDALKSGDKSLGIKIRFSGKDSYKNAQSNESFLLAEIYGRLYPENPIASGDYMMKFNTTVLGEQDLNKIKNVEMREKVKNTIFCQTWDNEKNFLKTRGLKTIAIPLDGDMFTIPEWIRDILDYEAIVSFHTQAITDLLPSIGIKLLSLSSSDKRYSNLVSF